MANFKKLDQIERRIRIELGDTIADVEVKDVMDYIRPACLRYYTAQPIRKLKKNLVTLGTTSVIIEDVMAFFWPDEDERQKYYFLGAVDSTFLLQGEELLSGGAGVSPFNVWMYQNLAGFGGLGGYGGSGQCSGSIGGGRYGGIMQDPLAQGLYATQKDRILGDESYEWDEINGRIRITSPAEGSVTLNMAFGYNGDPNNNEDDSPLKGVPFGHLDIVGRLVAEEISHNVLMSHGILHLGNTDFDIDTKLMQDVYDRLFKQNDKDLGDLTVPYILMA